MSASGLYAQLLPWHLASSSCRMKKKKEEEGTRHILGCLHPWMAASSHPPQGSFLPQSTSHVAESFLSE